jgi:uncharacterized membrane protein
LDRKTTAFFTQKLSTMAKKIISYLLAILLIVGGIAHFTSPEISTGFIPGFLPATLVHVVIGVLEIVLGIGVFIPVWKEKAMLGIMILMICFLPLHVIDIFRENPVIGSQIAAIIRVPVQLLIIAGAWYAWRGLRG